MLLYFLAMKYIIFLMFAANRAEIDDVTGCDGYTSSASEALRGEFQIFSDVMEKYIKEFTEKVEADIKIINSRTSSVVYTRWGKKACPPNAELVLSGFTAGSWYHHSGAAVDSLCLPRDPEWGLYRGIVETDRAYVYGAEYETKTFGGHLQTLHQHDVPCAVCLARNRSVVQMFPARKNCYDGWKLEYRGYLMAGYHAYQAGTEYTCIDEEGDSLDEGHHDVNGRLFYPVEVRCGSLKCPPYVDGRELVCVVCSKE